MDSGCPERRDVAAALAHLWRRAPLELVDYVADFACEHEIRFSTARRVRRGTQLFYTNYDDAPWNYIIEGDILDDHFVAIRLLRGAESVLLEIPGLTYGGFYFPGNLGQVRISRKYVVAPVTRTLHVFRREDGAHLRSMWSGHDDVVLGIGDELCVMAAEQSVQLCDLATGEVLDEWQRGDRAEWDHTTVAIDAHDAAVWIPGTRRSSSGLPGFRVPIVNRRFVRDRRSHPFSTPPPGFWHSVCLRGDWVYFASYGGITGIHANGTQVQHILSGLLQPDIISTPRTMILLLTPSSPERSACEMIRFTDGEDGTRAEH